MKTLGGYRLTSFLQKARRVKKQMQRDTQQLRRKLMNELEQMFDIAKSAVEAAKGDKTKAKQVQIWIRVMGYLGQVMNSLADSFDEAKAMEYFENLERMIHEAEKTSEGCPEA